MTRHPKLGAVERRAALWVNVLVQRELLESALNIKLLGVTRLPSNHSRAMNVGINGLRERRSCKSRSWVSTADYCCIRTASLLYGSGASCASAFMRRRSCSLLIASSRFWSITCA